MFRPGAKRKKIFLTTVTVQNYFSPVLLALWLSSLFIQSSLEISQYVSIVPNEFNSSSKSAHFVTLWTFKAAFWTTAQFRGDAFCTDWMHAWENLGNILPCYAISFWTDRTISQILEDVCCHIREQVDLLSFLQVLCVWNRPMRLPPPLLQLLHEEVFPPETMKRYSDIT